MKTAEETDWKALPMPELNTAIPLGLLYHQRDRVMVTRSCNQAGWSVVHQ